MLNYPGSEIRIDLEKNNQNLFEFNDVKFFSNKFDNIKSIEVFNYSKIFEKIKWKLDIVKIDKSRNKKNVKTFNIEGFLEDSLKVELDLFFKNLNLGEEKLYFKIRNISKFENIQLQIVLKNKYILDNFKIIDKFDNCYYVE